MRRNGVSYFRSAVVVTVIGGNKTLLKGNITRMRGRADWMSFPADDQILELARELGNVTPSVISEHGGPSASYATKRAKELVRYGLLNQIGHGLYGITDEGRAYLNEELDASTLGPAETEE